jgi:hypothetical protein
MTMTTAVAKPKAARSIVTTKLTAEGVKTALSKSASDQLERSAELCSHLEELPQFKELAHAAGFALTELLAKFKE